MAAGVFLTGAGTAFASSWRQLPLMSARKVVFTRGQYRFNPPERNHGSFEWSGILQDRAPDDGDNGYVKVRVEGHDWVHYYGKQGKSVRMHHADWDGAQRHTVNAYMRVCVDRGALMPDLCSGELHLRSPYGD
jgi:hypothetical protein